ncbi:uncharacterized protein [Haliotis asinina]|uniref:uncharacterized protein n=1 Tax=Haliotis asinina TaxID=109174 RepID=UPI0035319100
MRKWKVVVGVVLTLNIAVGIVVICLVVTTQQESFPSATLRSTADKLKEHLEETYAHIQQTPLRHSPSPQVISTQEHWNILKPIAFFTGLDFDNNNADNPSSTAVRNWMPFLGPGGRQYLYNGMTYENGSIVVPTGGVYVVYDHMKFYTEKNRRSDPEIDFHHSITRYNAASQQLETVSRNTVTENKNDIIDGSSLEYSSDIHVLVRLNAGDQLIVNVSHSEKLKSDRDWHYFGAYII